MMKVTISGRGAYSGHMETLLKYIAKILEHFEDPNSEKIVFHHLSWNVFHAFFTFLLKFFTQ